VKKRETAIIIGAGPAGLTAAYELLKQTNIKPIVLEMTNEIGGIARTVNYRGNRIDIGGHRFFSKSEVVMDWWRALFPVQNAPSLDEILLKIRREYPKSGAGADPQRVNRVLLFRQRISRIFYGRRFYDYPISLNLNTVANLGPVKMIRIAVSYSLAMLFPIRPEKSLEDFMINRFGKNLYRTFFRDYTTKVWGIPPSGIKPEWGAQRIKGLSITGVLIHAVKKLFSRKNPDIYQKGTQTSLIEQFLYPKLGPGQLWEAVAKHIVDLGGEIHMLHNVDTIRMKGGAIESVEATVSGKRKKFRGDYFFSTMPIRDLVLAVGKSAPANVREAASGLVYRDFMTAGLLLKKLKIKNKTSIPTVNDLVPDNWIYIQEPDVKVGRLQIFNNWSPYMVKDINTVWVGMEYFCNEGDDLWSMKDRDFLKFASDELAKIDIIHRDDVLDGVTIRSPKAYPAYFGTYDDFPIVRGYLDNIKNLFLMGRNGMHRYNNMDHSMLTAMEAVRCIREGVRDRSVIWDVNSEQEYHEKR
jgi:protoporphyrinogen oxidase